MSDVILPNAPLKEVLLELHWKLDYITEEKILLDKGFEQAVIKFIRNCSDRFGDVELLKPESIPLSAFIHRVTHRLFQKRGDYPLIQLGPGVFTVNDNNRNYRWSEFNELIHYGIERLGKSYEKELILSKAELWYIDKCSTNVLGDLDKFEFLEKHLNISVGKQDFSIGSLQDIYYSKKFAIDDTTLLNLNVLTGTQIDKKSDVIEWHTTAISTNQLNWEGLYQWIEQAHRICSDSFKKMISQELYEYFSKESV